ncbi:MAG TPA: amidohydrolase family protein [Rhizomicrobium sp.]|nr:amidohydrolase family protein [Rhizomicrobium sp.]
MGDKFDLVIRGGTIVDGSGSQPFRADLAVANGTIAEIGIVTKTGRTEIDARGRLVTPGFVDLHTHFDGQAIWSDRFMPSSLHGATTVVMGNCGVGFAPCRPNDHDRLVSLMEGVEDIPEIVMTTGLTWDWETFPQYLDAVASQPHDIDVAAYIPHSPIRVYVMGERGLNREPATTDDIEAMKALVREALTVGALGFATSRTTFHRTSEGHHIPSFDTAERELQGIASVLAERKAGVIQMVPIASHRDGWREELDMLVRLAETSGRPLTFTFAQHNEDPEEWRSTLAFIQKANETLGLQISMQMLPRPVGVILGFYTTFNPFMDCPSFAPLKDLPVQERVAALQAPELRNRLIRERPLAGVPTHALARQFDRMFPLDDPPDYEPSLETSVGAIAARKGVSPEEVAYDLLLEGEGRRFLYVAMANYADGNLEFLQRMIGQDTTVLALGDAGAHYGVVCDASYSTYALTHWSRDRYKGRFPVEMIIRKLTQVPAAFAGLNDRGVLKKGYKADINVIDYDALRLHKPYLVRDMPGNGQRLIQRADGYAATIVSGVPVYLEGIPTGMLPGKLVRGPQSAKSNA